MELENHLLNGTPFFQYSADVSPLKRFLRVTFSHMGADHALRLLTPFLQQKVRLPCAESWCSRRVYVAFSFQLSTGTFLWCFLAFLAANPVLHLSKIGYTSQAPWVNGR